ncbi:MAG: hypothetical protein HQL95_01315 [Magnetococcales bacterium]|nr:hypothetical protein [Magnetococcales bacterium]
MAGFGLGILVISVLLVFVPLAGGYLTALPGLLALFIGRAGARWAMIGVAINAAHVLFLSDFLRFNAASGLRDGIWRPVVIYVGLVLLQVVAGLLLGFRHFGGEDASVSGEESRGSR